MTLHKMCDQKEKKYKHDLYFITGTPHPVKGPGTRDQGVPPLRTDKQTETLPYLVLRT